MYLFQFGLAQEAPQPVAAVAQGDLFIAGIVLWSAFALAIIVGFLFVLRFFLRRMSLAKQSTFRRVTLLITLPKFRREEESERGPTKDQVQEAIAAAESFFSSIGGLKAQRGIKAWLFGRQDEFSFEIVVDKKLIKFFMTVPVELREFLEQQLSAAYADAFTEEVEDYNIFQPDSVILGSNLVFRREHAFPIKTYRELEKDPLNAITNVLSKIPEGDGAAFQFMVRSSYAKWRKKGISIASNMQQGMKLSDAIRGKKKGKSSWLELAGFGSDKSKEPEKDYRLSPLEEQIVKGLETKASKAGMDVCIRMITSSKTATGAQTLLQNMLNAFAQYNIYEYGNSFVRVTPRRKKNIIRDFIYRGFNEHNTIVLNAEEMAGLWHLPLPWTETPNIKWLGARKGPAPSGIPGPEDGDIELGYNMFRGIKSPIWMKSVDRTRHMYIVGKSGSGKSQLIAAMAIQDIKAGHGVAVVEPHGDLIELILANIPKDRVDDVIVFNPSDMERPMGLNMLEAPNESMKDFAVQEMISVFYKLFPPEMIGPMFEHQMRNFMLTLMSDPENPGTIAEIPRMVTDKKFQDMWRAKLKDPVVRSFWEDEIDNTSDYHKSEMMGYLVSKVGRFVENEMMRNIIGQSKSSFNVREVMDQKKILLVNLSKGKTGDVNAELLGLVIVSKLQMAALTRADLPEDQRHDFYLYIDEFQNFITDSIATILSEARKYRLNLIIAHQYIGQLVKNNDTKIRDAVFGNVGTNFVARIGPEDVETLGKIYSPEFSGYDLINSDKFTWYVKMIVDNAQQKPFTMNFSPPPKGDVELATAIKELSRLKYGRDRSIVEAEIMERTALGNRGGSIPAVPESTEF
ncbi:MAG TPA: type IV secretory system conjugative DNA transfer family protein [Patescibacteria group bacterium]|nr:type IV secretory system conjugative DNA transfer family protein [Patescibacteria group bacterium]